MDWLLYAIVLPLTLFLLATAGCAVHWAVKHGQTQALWRSARSCFATRGAEEPSSELLDPSAPASSDAARQI